MYNVYRVLTSIPEGIISNYTRQYQNWMYESTLLRKGQLRYGTVYVKK